MSIILKKPLSLLDRNINLDTKSLTKTVVKIVAKTVSLKWDEAFEEAPEVLDALGLIQSEEEIAYLLVITSFLDAIAKLVHNEGIIEGDNVQTIEVIDLYINEKLEKQQLILDIQLINSKDFYKSALLEELKVVLEKYLLNLQLDKIVICNLLERFSSYFLFSLNKNWLKDSRYTILLNILEQDSPFSILSHKLTKITKHAKRHFWLNDVCTCHGLLPSHSA